MKVLPAGSQVTSVTWRKRPSSAGSGGFGCFTGPVSSSEASCLRPNTITTWPLGLNLTTMSEPLSTAQMLSSRSTRTVCAKDQAYRFLPISRMNLPSGANSSSCAAAAAYAGPLVVPREKTKICPLEFTATPLTSPRYRSLGSFSRFGTESNAITGTCCCASSGGQNRTSSATSQCFMTPPSALVGGCACGSGGVAAAGPVVVFGFFPAGTPVYTHTGEGGRAWRFAHDGRMRLKVQPARGAQVLVQRPGTASVSKCPELRGDQRLAPTCPSRVFPSTAGGIAPRLRATRPRIWAAAGSAAGRRTSPPGPGTSGRQLRAPPP